MHVQWNWQMPMPGCQAGAAPRLGFGSGVLGDRIADLLERAQALALHGAPDAASVPIAAADNGTAGKLQLRGVVSSNAPD